MSMSLACQRGFSAATRSSVIGFVNGARKLSRSGSGSPESSDGSSRIIRVQNVDVSQGPLERWLGLKKLTIRTASASTDATIPGLDDADAEQLRIRILERAGQDAAV